MTSIRDQIAAARALRDEWIHPDNPSYGGCIELIEGEMGWMLESLERACELLEKQTGRKIGCECKTCDGDYRRAVDREIDAFLAGEVTRG